MVSRFPKGVSEAESLEINNAAVLENTKKSTKFDVNVFQGKF